MRKYKRIFRGNQHIGSKAIPKNSATFLAHKIRKLGRNVRVIPTANGTRLYVSKQIRPYSSSKGTGGKRDKLPMRDLSMDPFANILTSSRNQRTDIVPVGPNKENILTQITDALDSGELDYMEYSDLFQKAMDDTGLSFRELSGRPDLKDYLRQYDTDLLNSAYQQGLNEQQYRYAQAYLGNTYMPLLDAATGWTDIGNYGNKNKQYSRDEIIKIAAASNAKTKEYQQIYEDSISKKSAGRFTNLRVSNSDYFGKPGIYEWLENNDILLPFEIVKKVSDGEEETVLFRMDQAATNRMVAQYRKARDGESGTMGPEVDFLSRLGGDLSAFDADYYGALIDAEQPFTFFDYMEIEQDQDDYVLEGYTDLADKNDYIIIKSVLGVVGPDDYGGPEFKGTYEYRSGDETLGGLFPKSASFFPETYRDPLLGLRGLIWRDNIILNKKSDMRTIQESVKVPISTNVENLRQRITADGYMGDPLAVFAYLTGGGLSKLEQEDLDYLVEFDVREKYGDPQKIFPSIRKASLGDEKAKQRLIDKNDGEWVSSWEYGAPFYPDYLLLQDELDAEQGMIWDSDLYERVQARERGEQTKQDDDLYDRRMLDRKVSEVKFSNSKRKGKKMKATFTFDDGGKKTTHFGGKGYGDFTTHNNPAKKKAYEARHSVNEDWSDPTSAGALSKWILWNKQTKKQSIEDYKSRFGIDG